MFSIKRQVLPEIINHLSSKEITLITGARQVGKTTLMKEIQRIQEQKHQKTLYLNLDFDNDFVYFKSQEKFLQKLRLEFGQQAGFVFLDEIQRKENAGLFLKGLYDRDLPYKFIISGSGSMELKEKIHESLTGRKRIFELSTITFREFVNYKTEYRYETRLGDFFTVEPEQTENLLNEYLSYGGYPRIVTEPQEREKQYLINEIYNSYLRKDIAFLLKLDRPELFTKLVQLLAHNTGKILNYTTLASDVGVSIPTVKKYLWYAENTFIIKLIQPFFRNKRKEIKKSPVPYFCDIGLRNFALNEFGQTYFRPRSGYLFQNFIFRILGELDFFHFAQIKFWRTTDQAEVDFVIQAGKDVIPIEVKFAHLKKTSMSRSFQNFIERYQPEKAFVVNLSTQKEFVVGTTTVKVIPFYQLFDVR